MARKQRIQGYIPEREEIIALRVQTEMKNKVIGLAKKSDVTVSEYIRNLIRRHLQGAKTCKNN